VGRGYQPLSTSELRLARLRRFLTRLLARSRAVSRTRLCWFDIAALYLANNGRATPRRDLPREAGCARLLRGVCLFRRYGLACVRYPTYRRHDCAESFVNPAGP
jgi:hypothetical protein